MHLDFNPWYNCYCANCFCQKWLYQIPFHVLCSSLAMPHLHEEMDPGFPPPDPGQAFMMNRTWWKRHCSISKTKLEKNVELSILVLSGHMSSEPGCCVVRKPKTHGEAACNVLANTPAKIPITASIYCWTYDDNLLSFFKYLPCFHGRSGGGGGWGSEMVYLQMNPAPSHQVTCSLQAFPAEASDIIGQRQTVPALPCSNHRPTECMELFVMWPQRTSTTCFENCL